MKKFFEYIVIAVKLAIFFTLGPWLIYLWVTNGFFPFGPVYVGVAVVGWVILKCAEIDRKKQNEQRP